MHACSNPVLLLHFKVSKIDPTIYIL